MGWGNAFAVMIASFCTADLTPSSGLGGTFTSMLIPTYKHTHTHKNEINIFKRKLVTELPRLLIVIKIDEPIESEK